MTCWQQPIYTTVCNCNCPCNYPNVVPCPRPPVICDVTQFQFLMSTIYQLRSQLLELQTQLTTLQNKNSTLASTNEALQAQTEALTATNATLQTQTETLTATNATLQTQIQTLTSANADYLSQISDLQKQLATVQEQLKDAQNHLTAFIDASNTIARNLNTAYMATNPTIDTLKDAIDTGICDLNTAIENAGGSSSVTPGVPNKPITSATPSGTTATYTIQTTGLPEDATTEIYFDGNLISGDTLTADTGLVVPDNFVAHAFDTNAMLDYTGTVTVNPDTKVITITFTPVTTKFTIIPMNAQYTLNGTPLGGNTFSTNQSLVGATIEPQLPGYQRSGYAHIDLVTGIIELPVEEVAVPYTLTVTGLPDTIQPTISFKNQTITSDTVSMLPSEALATNFVATAPGYTSTVTVSQPDLTVTIAFQPAS